MCWQPIYQSQSGLLYGKLSKMSVEVPTYAYAYGECSDGVKHLLDVMAQSRLQSLGLRKGSLEAAKELSLVTGYLRRRLSTAIVKANVKCLLERLVKVGEGRGQADRRRQWARQEEARARLEREAQWQARITGRNLVRRGDFLSL